MEVVQGYESLDRVAARVQLMRTQSSERDQKMQELRLIREGKIDQVAPGLFSTDWPKAIVANFIDVAARDLAEVIAPLPSFNASAGDRTSDTAIKKADKRTRIVYGYLENSCIDDQMVTAADWYLTYGFVPAVVDLDFDQKRPRARFVDPSGVYYDKDRHGQPLRMAQVVKKSARALAVDFPEFEDAILGDMKTFGGDAQLELIVWRDHRQHLVYLPERQNLVLSSVKNPVGKPLFDVVERPGGHGPRGQFDDIVWLQLARGRFAVLGLEAAHKSIQAPIAVPQDVQELAFGGDEIMRSSSPEKIRRVDLPVPSEVFAEQSILEQEARTGSRFPEARLGGVDASIVTGKGVQALMGGFDTQVKTAQTVFAGAFRRLMACMLEADEKIWPNVEKTARGTSAGSTYEITYKAKKDIDGNYVVDVTYGLMAGLDPNRALIFGLQARGDRLISRDWLRRQMPWSVDVSQEEIRIDAEEMREALKQSIMGLAQAIPVLAQQGMDPAEPIRQLTAALNARLSGKQLEEAIAEAFKPPEPPPGAELGGVPGEEGVPGGPGGGEGTVPGLQTSGLPYGVAKAGQGQGGRPDLQVLLAGLSGGGQPNLSGRVERRIPA